MAKMKDQFDQFMYLEVTMSAANTLTFARAGIGLSMFDYAGLIVTRIEYSFARTVFNELQANADEFVLAVTGSNSISGIGADRPEVYDRLTLQCNTVGAATSSNVEVAPVVHDFTGHSGGGILIPAQDVYLAAFSQGFGAAETAYARVYYRVISLQAADFIELVQRLRVIST